MEEPKNDEVQSSGESLLVTSDSSVSIEKTDTSFELRSPMEYSKTAAMNNFPRTRVAVGSNRRSASLEFSRMPVLNDYPYSPGAVRSRALDSAETLQRIKEFSASKVIIDTAQPFDSVKSAVSKFGGIIDWKAHKVMAVEKTTHILSELDKVQEDIPRFKKQSEAAQVARDEALEELDSTKKLVEELKDSLEKTQTEEVQAKQDSELAQLRVEEMEQGISDSASTAAKAQLEVAKARHEAATEELKSVKEELEALQGDYHRLVSERNWAVTSAEEAVSAAKDGEKKAEDLTIELITIKEALESAHASHLEAEERRIALAMVRDQDSLIHEKELLQAIEELRLLSDQHLAIEELKSKFETASSMLLKLKTELAFYMERKLNKDPEATEGSDTNKAHASITSDLASAEKELEDVKSSIEKTKDEVNCLTEAASSLKAELDRETEALATLRQREGMTSVTVSSLEAELSRMQSEVELVLTRGKEGREKTEELPKVLQQANLDVDRAKSVAQLASEELRRAKEEAEQAKSGASTMESRLTAALKEIEAAKASEELAVAAVKAMLESEQKQGDFVTTESEAEAEAPSGSKGVTLQLEEYYTLSKTAREAEESAKERVISAVEKIKEAKNSEQMNLQKLEGAQKELEEKKEALKETAEMAGRANEGKLAAEQELRDWRFGNELRRRASDASSSHLEMNASPPQDFEASREAPHRMSFVSCPDLYADPTAPEKPRRKKSFFPRIVMFLARKKAQSLK